MIVEFVGKNEELIKGLVIRDKHQLTSLIQKMQRVDTFAFDTETTSLRVRHPGEVEAVGISICFGTYDTYYIPIGHVFDKNQLPIQYVINKLKPIFEKPKITIIGQNLSFDLHVMANYGVEVKTTNLFDTMIGFWDTDENLAKGLKERTRLHYGVTQDEYNGCLSTVTSEEKKFYGLKSNNKPPFQLVRISVGAPYAMADAYWTWRHHCDWLLDELENEEMTAIYHKVQIPFLKTLYNMERRGIKVDVERLKGMSIKAVADLEDLAYQIYEISGIEFNIASTQQLSEILFGYRKMNKKGEFTGNVDLIERSFGFAINVETKGGAPGTGEEALKGILKKTYKRDVRKQEGQEMLKLVLKYKKLAKLQSAFIDGLIEQVYKDGRIHPSFNQCGCLTSETLVPTDKGIFPIGMLAKLGSDGEFVEKQLKVVNMHREMEDTKYVVKYENRETIKLTTLLGLEIEGTLNHPLIVNSYNYPTMTNNIDGCRLKGLWKGAEEWRKLGGITTDDYVAVPIGYNVFAKDYVELNDCPDISHHFNAKPVIIPKVLDEDLAEFMGMYYADGSIHELNGTFSIRITNGSKDVIERVNTLCTKLFNLKSITIPEPKKNSATTYITALNLKPIESLLELDKGAVNKVIPNIILQSPKSVVLAFLRGLTLDGCFLQESGKSYFKFTVSNSISARYIQELLLNLGIISSVRQDKHKTENVFNISIYNDNYIKFRDTVGFIELNKYHDIDFNVQSNHYRVDGNTLWVKVKHIARGVADVFDFNVPDTHSFISGAFISHNTDSGRISCSSPNLQQLPRPVEMPYAPLREKFDNDIEYHNVVSKYEKDKAEAEFWKFYEIRDCFVADNEDEVIIACDYSNLEMRVLAHFSLDPLLMETFLADEDAHGGTAVNMFKLDCTAKEVKKLYPHLRQIAKIINFLLMYGGGAFTLFNKLDEEDALDENGDPITKEKAQEYYDMYFEAYAGVAEFILEQKHYAHAHEMVYSVIGRKRRLHDINSRDYKTVAYEERLSVNSPVQGSASDLMAVCQPVIDNNEELKALGCTMRLQVHDELVFVCKKENAEKAIVIIKDLMEHPLSKPLNIPLRVDAGFGETYAKAK